MRKISILIRRDMGLLLRSNKALITSLTLLVTLAVVAQSLVAGIIAGYAKHLDATSQLAVVELNTLAEQSPKPLNDDTLGEASTLPHVEEVRPWLQHDLELSSENDWPDPVQSPGSVWATTWMAARQPALKSGKVPSTGPLQGEIILPSTVSGGSLDSLVGRTVDFSYTVPQGRNEGFAATIRLKVIATYDNSTPGRDGEQPSYLAPEQVKALFGKHPPTEYNYAYVKVDSAQNASEVQRQLASLGFSTLGAASQLADATGIVGTLASADHYTMPALAMLSAAFGYLLGTGWLTQRRRDMGLLRAIGWRGRQLFAVSMAEVAAAGLFCVVVGLVLGTLLAQAYTWLVPERSLEMGLPAAVPLLSWGFAAQLLVVPALMAVGALLHSIRIARSSPDELIREV